MATIATTNNFSDIIRNNKVVLVDLWAEWCGPCRMLSPTVDEIEQLYTGKVEVVKCNVDDCQDVAVNYGVRGIPTLLYFKDGVEVDRTVGAVTKKEITDIIDKVI
jgi:thioredoxin 1